MSKASIQTMPSGGADLPASAADLREPSRWGNRLFEGVTLLSALCIGVFFLLVAYVLIQGSIPAFKQYGWSFLSNTHWNPVTENFGALPFILGTLSSAAIALLIAVPLSIGTASFLTDLAPLWMRQPLTSVIEMLAAVPSVIWGLWGLFVLLPWLHDNVYVWLNKHFSGIPIFAGPIEGAGSCILSAGIIVAIMILPIVTSVSREILRSVPDLQREAAYGLGATRWEVTRIAVLSYARRGLMGAAVLGLGRALGETMAVTMVVGNSPVIHASLLQPGWTLASVIANQFGEASDDLMRSVLFEVGLVLVGVTILVNIGALILIRSIETPGSRRA
jgi:phosphate transport system permease protein